MQCIAYAIYITPVFFMWEKLIGTHHKSNWIRLPSRLPVGEPLCIFSDMHAGFLHTYIGQPQVATRRMRGV